MLSEKSSVWAKGQTLSGQDHCRRSYQILMQMGSMKQTLEDKQDNEETDKGMELNAKDSSGAKSGTFPCSKRRHLFVFL